jgi:hypothetical protein
LNKLKHGYAIRKIADIIAIMIVFTKTIVVFGVLFDYVFVKSSKHIIADAKSVDQMTVGVKW